MRFPLIAFTNNIVFNDRGEAYAIYRLRGEAYNYLPKAEREMVVRRLEQFLFGFEGRGSILLLNEELRMDEAGYLAAAGVPRNLPPEVAQEAYRHARSVRSALTAGARRRRRYIALQLRLGNDDDWKAVLQEFRDSTLGTFLRSERWFLTSRRVKEAQEREEIMNGRVRLLTDDRINFSDLDFIIRRNVHRVGVLPPPLPSRDGGKFTPALVAAFSDGCVIDEKPTYLTITGGADDQHHQVFVTFPDVPKALPEVGAEWLASLDAMEEPVDAVVHFSVLRAHKAKQKTETKRKFLKGQIKEAFKGDEEPSTDEEYGLIEGRTLVGKLSGGQSLVSMSVTLALAGRDLKSLRASASKLVEVFNSGGFRAVRPAGDQIKCLYSFIPGSQPAAPMVECDPGFVASSGPMVNMEVGDGQGYFIGWSGASPVCWSPGYAARTLNRSNAIFVSGSLGSGKSETVKDFSYLVRLSGGYIFVVDPKKKEYSSALGQLFTIKEIDLCPGGTASLNPFMLSQDTRRARGIALDFLSIVLNLRDDNDPRRVAVSRAVDAVAAMPAERRHMQSCLEELFRMQKEYPHPGVAGEAGQCALLLESLRDGSMGHLVFGRDSSDEIHPITVISLQGLPLPRNAQSLTGGRITESERQGLGMLFLASAMAREVAFSLPPEVIKCLIFDEAWMLANISEGARMLDELLRMSARSFGAIPIVITQNATDIDNLQSIKNLFGYVLCFRAQAQAEINANIELLGTDLEDELERRKGGQPGFGTIFRSMESGWCIMRDAMGRIGHVYVDPRPEYLLKIFDTSPKSSQGEGQPPPPLKWEACRKHCEPRVD